MMKKKDRRVERTHTLLRSALVSLIEERGFEVLTVQDILDRANVGRATFYAHFDNKEDLLVSGFEDLRASLKQRQREALAQRGGVEERAFSFSREMFAHANEYRRVFQAMAGRHSGAMVQQILHQMLVELVRDDMRAMTARGEAESAPAETTVQFLAGGLFGLLMWWMKGKMRLSPQEIDTLFLRLAVPAMKAALG